MDGVSNRRHFMENNVLSTDNFGKTNHLTRITETLHLAEQISLTNISRQLELTVCENTEDNKANLDKRH